MSEEQNNSQDTNTEAPQTPQAEQAQQTVVPNVQTSYYNPQAQARNFGNVPEWLQGLVVTNGGMVPANTSKFSWAAFFFTWIYFFVRGQWKIALAILGVDVALFILGFMVPGIGLLGIAVNILSGVYGKSLAFLGAEPGRFPNKEALDSSDKPWVIIGIVLTVLVVLFTILLFILLGGLVFAAISDPSVMQSLESL